LLLDVGLDLAGQGRTALNHLLCVETFTTKFVGWYGCMTNITKSRCICQDEFVNKW